MTSGARAANAITRRSEWPLMAQSGSPAAAQQRPLSRVTRTTYARLAGHFLGLLALPFGKIAADISELLWAP